MPSATFRHSVVVPIDQERAWQSLQSVEPWRAIGGIERVWDVRHNNEGHLSAYRFAAKAGGKTHEGVADVVESRPPDSMLMELDTGMLRGVIAVALATNGDSTNVEITMRVESKGLLTTALFPAISSAIESDFDHQVELFAAAL